MCFSGNWINRKSDEQITFSKTHNDDEYLLEIKVKNESIFEIINIFITNDTHSLIPNSTKFGRATIIFLNDKRIQISNEIYDKE